MIAEKLRPGVLIVSGSSRGRENLAALLPREDFEAAEAVSSAGEARRLLLCRSFDIIIINTPLSDEYGTELAEDISADTGCGVMLLVKSEAYEQAAYRTEECGVLTVIKPVQRQSLLQTMRLLVATRARLRTMERKNEELKAKLEEVRLVGRAKCLLMEREAAGESEAHRKIEKAAMDSRRSRRAVAQDIINKYI